MELLPIFTQIAHKYTDLFEGFFCVDVDTSEKQENLYNSL